jgi:hypothetical protein
MALLIVGEQPLPEIEGLGVGITDAGKCETPCSIQFKVHGRFLCLHP